MKRTVEVVLTIIGAFVYALGAFFGGLIIWLENNQGVLEDIVEQDPNVSQNEINDLQMMMQGMGQVGTIILIGAILCVILGIVAMFLFKGNKKPKAAGILLIVVGGVTTLITFGFALFAGVFYVIAGIMGLVRKPKQEVNLEQY
ncbi:DUF4064 domain-containing protein [Gracilibacillus sp. YIM 98692]|uniref:DUF4064 domain-containing protein n=1 Tax=Gracilibacillus sp. YIM 98692 TaxID=2663532 RepID=UPI0013CF4639|nr:DUF4064 domain-containing protein [Gracilibacillus sp. YIM 98692]